MRSARHIATSHVSATLWAYLDPARYQVDKLDDPDELRASDQIAVKRLLTLKSALFEYTCVQGDEVLRGAERWPLGKVGVS